MFWRVHSCLRLAIFTHQKDILSRGTDCECNACIMSAHASLSVLRALAHVALRAT